VIFAALIQSASSLPTDASALESSISALESAISALESEVKALESSSVPWEYSVWVFTSLVVVGVALELLVIRHEYRDDMEAWALAHFGVLRSPGRPSITKLSVEVGSVLLITIGIMGELGIGIKIASINGVLRGKSAELRSKNAELRSKSDQLVALLHNETEGIKLENIRLRAIVQPRTISEADRKKLGERLHKFASSFKGRKVKISSQHGDAEGILFSLEIVDIVNRAAIEVDPVIGRIEVVGGIYMGVVITGPISDEIFIRSLATALGTSTGTAVRGEWNSKYSEVGVMVGFKPIEGLPPNDLMRK
jgi:hypothetical protein